MRSIWLNYILHLYKTKKRGVTLQLDLFENEMEPDKFRYTNAVWNELRLNTSWSIGSVASLIEKGTFRTKEEWKEFYFHSGNQRLEKLKQMNLSEDLKRKVILIRPDGEIPYNVKRLNYEYGRTRGSLAFKGEVLYNEIVKRGNPYGLTKRECQYAVFYRVIAESWNGVVVRERNTMDALQIELKKQGVIVSCKKTSGRIDYKYEVDYELFKNDTLLCGIQVKPPSYLQDTPYLRETKEVNEYKNRKYKQDYKVDVFYVYSKTNGEIVNEEVIEEIISYISKTVSN